VEQEKDEREARRLALKFLLSFPLDSLDTSTSNRSVHNLTGLPLSPLALKALGLGLNFVPTPRSTDSKVIDIAYKKFSRSLRIRCHFHDKPAKKQSRTYSPNPNWSPPKGPREVENFLSTLKSQLSRAKTLESNRKSYPKANLDRDSKKALDALLQDWSLRVSPTDKNLGPAVHTEAAYRKEILSQIALPTFRKIERSEAMERLYDFEQQARFWLSKLLPWDDNAFEYIFETITLENSRFPRAYIMWKVYKAILAGRPALPVFISLDHSLYGWTRNYDQ
jgi:hypothetical protein